MTATLQFALHQIPWLAGTMMMNEPRKRPIPSNNGAFNHTTEGTDQGASDRKMRRLGIDPQNGHPLQAESLNGHAINGQNVYNGMSNGFTTISPTNTNPSNRTHPLHGNPSPMVTDLGDHGTKCRVCLWPKESAQCYHWWLKKKADRMTIISPRRAEGFQGIPSSYDIMSAFMHVNLAYLDLVISQHSKFPTTAWLWNSVNNAQTIM